MSDDARPQTFALRAAVVILNWQNGPATIRCIDAVQRMTLRDTRIYVIDNGSVDGAPEQIRRYLDTTGLVVDEWRYEASAGRLVREDPSSSRTTPATADYVVIDCNLGYGGGNNVGIAMAMNDGADVVWILNNDARPEPDALDEVVRLAAARADVGMVGATILVDDGSDQIQSVGGGRYWWMLGRASLILQGAARDPARDAALAEPDYIDGAALLLTRPMIQDVGGFEEGFHLYCEEIDLAERARRRGWGLAVAASAIVRHEFGASAGSSLTTRSRTPNSYFYASRAAMMLARRHRPHWLPTVALARCALAASLAIRGLRSAALAVLRGTLAGLSAPLVRDRSYRAVARDDPSVG